MFGHKLLRLAGGLVKNARMGFLAVGCAVALLTSAQAVQLQDSFDNATYDGAYDSTVWAVNAAAGTVTQDAAGGQLTLGPAAVDWDLTMLGTKAPIDFSSSTSDLGTEITVTINSYSVDTTSGLWDQGDIMFAIMLTNASSIDNYDWYNSGDDSLSFNVHLIKNVNDSIVEIYQRDGGIDHNVGTQLYQSNANMLSFPLEVKLLLNETRYEASLNGTLISSGYTGADVAAFGGQAQLRVQNRSNNTGRGSIVLDSVTVSDVDAGSFSVAAPTEISDDFDNAANNGSADASIWQIYKDGAAGTVAQAGGAMVVTPDTSGDWLSCGLVTKEALNLSDNMASLKVTVSDVTVNTPRMRVLLGLRDSGVAGTYWASGANCIEAFFTVDELGVGQVYAYSKAAGNSYAAGAEAITTVAGLDMTTPFTFELRANEQTVEVWLNDQLVGSGAHQAAFGPGLYAAISCQNDGAGRGACSYSDFSYSMIAPVDQISDDFNTAAFDGAYNGDTWIYREDGAGSAVQGSGVMTMDPADGEWLANVLTTRNVIALEAGEMASVATTVSEINVTTGAMRVELDLSSYQASGPHYFNTAGVVNAVLASDGSFATLHVNSKAAGNPNSVGEVDLVTPVNGLDVSSPFTFELRANATRFYVFFNGEEIASGTHTAALGNQVAGVIGAQNEAGGLGDVSFDDFLLTAGVELNPNAATLWQLFN